MVKPTVPEDNENNPINPCQYWVIDEPVSCKWWDKLNTFCDFDEEYTALNEETGEEETKHRKAQFAPYCNLLGTYRGCKQYEMDPEQVETADSSGDCDAPTSETTPTCILPDPFRHTFNKKTGYKWVLRTKNATYDSYGNIITHAEFGFSEITKYNNGKCDCKGTRWDCTGYTPHHLSFGFVEPLEDGQEPFYPAPTASGTTASGLVQGYYGGYRTPLEHVILNKRAQISPCYWWEGPLGEFNTGNNTDFDTGCTYTPASGVEPYVSGNVALEYDDEGNLVAGNPYQFKCNGASSDCPQYTGICWQYCVDPKLDPGDKVLAEQILELRYYVRRENWTIDTYTKVFPEEGIIYTWEGTVEFISVNDMVDKWGMEKAEAYTTQAYYISATKVYMDTFDSFEVKYDGPFSLTHGLPSKDGVPGYPSLIRQLDDLSLEPIIMNTFYGEEGLEKYIETSSLIDDKEAWIYGYTPHRDGNTYVINWADPDLSQDKVAFPPAVFEFKSMLEMELALGDAFNDVYEKMDKVLRGLEILAPEKLRLDIGHTAKNTFFINVPTFLGTNRIMVFTKKENERWQFDKVDFEKYFFGGRIQQTHFSVKGDDKSIHYLPDYMSDFGHTKQKDPGIFENFPSWDADPGYMMGHIGFNVIPFTHLGVPSTLYNVYNDWHYKELPKRNPETTHYVADIENAVRVIVTEPEPIDYTAYHYAGHNLYATEYKDIVASSNKLLPSGHIILTFNEEDWIDEDGNHLASPDATASGVQQVLQSVFKKWQVSDLQVEYLTERPANEEPEDDDVEIDGKYYEITGTCDLDVILHGGDEQLLANQLVVFPADMEDFVGLCSVKARIKAGYIYTFQKWSFNRDPESLTEDDKTEIIPINFEEANQVNLDTEFLREVTDGYLNNDTPFSEEKSWPYNVEIPAGITRSFELRKFQSTLILSATFKGKSGRLVGQYKTKAVTWVRQPLCPDVEIYYDWRARYHDYEMKPTCWCHGSADAKYLEDSYENRVPRCGDHDLYDLASVWALWDGNPKKGPMWWPYNRCEGYEFYEIITHQVVSAFEVMSEFKELIRDENGEWKYKHGQHDLRMLGPDVHIGWEDGWCPVPTACPCGIQHFNKKQVVTHEGNEFAGYANYRGSSSSFQIKSWKFVDEAPNQFGNCPRAALRSYRSTDKVQFYYDLADPKLGYFIRTWQWLPTPMYFTDLNITSNEHDWMYDYSTHDGVNSKVVNPMGSLLFYLDIENISLFENIDYGNRFRFEEIFRAQGVGPNTAMAYPSGSGRLTLPWYEFLSYPIMADGGTDETIHWAWREWWKPLERRYGLDLNKIIFMETKEDLNVQNREIEGDQEAPLVSNGELIGYFYENEAEEVEGYFLCFDLSYPDYQYDWKMREYRTVAEEKQTYIKFIAPHKDAHTGEYLNHCAVQLGDGPYKYFSMETGDWVAPTDDGKDPEVNMEDPGYGLGGGVYIYDECVANGNWINAVNIFSDEFDLEPDENRTMVLQTGWDDVNKKILTDDFYYNCGLFIYLISAATRFLPAKAYLIEHKVYNPMVYPDDWNRDDDTGTITAVANSDLAITYDFIETIRAVIRIDISAMFGYKKGKDPEDIKDPNNPDKVITRAKDQTRTDYFYHWPAFDVYAKDPDNPDDWILLHSQETMEMVNKESKEAKVEKRTYILNAPLPYLGKGGSTAAAIIFRFTPTDIELADGKVSLKKRESPHTFDIEYQSQVFLSNIELLEHKYIDAIENINLHERRYFVSHGIYGDFPPQGPYTTTSGDREHDDEDLGYLTVAPGETSTCWQLDHRLGIMATNYTGIQDTAGPAMSMNKCRGRIMYDIIPYLQPVSGDIHYIESRQKALIDLALSKGDTRTIFSLVNNYPLLSTHMQNNDVYDPEGVSLYNQQVYPGTGDFINTIVMPLSGLIMQPRFSPGGHLFVPTPMLPSRCGNRTFRRVFMAVSADSKSVDDSILDANAITANLVGFEGMGLGTIDLDPLADTTGPWASLLLPSINEVTRAAMGHMYLFERLFLMSWLAYYKYPAIFSRTTYGQVFGDTITSLTLGQPIRPYIYFPNNTVGYHGGYDRDLLLFNTYGGFKGRYWGPDFGGEDPDVSDDPLIKEEINLMFFTLEVAGV